jgi:D-amino-acid dehydrogenase
MKIAIVGAGVAGVASAYELARGGHQVTVFERRASVAEESSFAPGAALGAGLLAPWAVPGTMAAPRLAGAGPRVHLAGASLAELRWLWHWRRAARQAQRSSAPTPAVRALARLVQFSQQCFIETAEALELVLERAPGALVLLPDARSAAPLRAAVAALRDAGAELHGIDGAAARAMEPGLSGTPRLDGALHLPQAEAANCRQFTGALRQAAQQLGVAFAFQSEVARLVPAPGGLSLHLAGDAAAQRFDAAVLCLGAHGAPLLESLGLRLGMVALWGCSLTAPLREHAAAPQGVVIDVARQVSISRLGQRVRVAGGAELGRGHGAPHPATVRQLHEALDTWFPGSLQRAGMQLWRGARPMRPGGLPVLGASSVPGLWLNMGHGGCGWSLASGAARLLADAMGGRPTALAPDELAHFAPGTA